MFTHTRRSVSFPHRETLISGMQTFRPSVSTFTHLQFDIIYIGAMLCANEVEMKSEVPYELMNNWFHLVVVYK